MYTGYDPTEMDTVLRRCQDGTSNPFPCPRAYAEYNRHTGGVDKGDQMRSYYGPKIKSRKFYKYIANFLLGVVVTNSYTLYKGSRPAGAKVVTLKTFQRELASHLIGEYCSRRKAGRTGNIIATLSIHHHPCKIPTSSTSSAKKRGRCAWCQERHHRKDTQWFCHECGAWLCLTGSADQHDCWYMWHKRELC